MSDPFSVFDLPRRLGLDLAATEAAWIARARDLHPDHVACATPGAIAEATARAAAYNAAWKVLRDPHARAKAWLDAEGAAVTPPRGGPPPDLAMRGFRIQEAVESRDAGDATASVELEALDAEVRADLAAARRDFTALCASEPSEGAPERVAFRGRVLEWVGRYAYLLRQEAQLLDARGDA